MIEIGRLCVKIAGRDAGLKCAVIEILDKNTVLIDGQTRRRKCNIRHLEPLKEKIDLKKHLEKNGIASRDFFTPLHTMPPLKQDIEAPNSQELSTKGLLLPLYPDMTKEEQDYIIKTINGF